MNIIWPVTAGRIGRACFGISILSIALCGCSTPHGYGVDERAMRTADGSSGVVAGAETNSSSAASTANAAAHNQSTYLSLIAQMQHEGQYFASLAHLDSYEARYGRSPDSILLRGDAERLTDQPELASRSYTALKDTPLAGSGYRGLSLLAGARGDFSTAAGLLEEALKTNSTDAATLSDLGYARLRLGDLAGARVPLMTAAQLTPANAKVMSNLALYLILDHDNNQAEAVMKSAEVTDQTRHAIYAQASQISHGGTGNAAQAGSATLLPGNAARLSTSLASNAGAASSKSTSALRIDFALATPTADGSDQSTVASTAR